jgi:hypothetical protein
MSILRAPLIAALTMFSCTAFAQQGTVRIITPDSEHIYSGFTPMCGRLRVGKNFLHDLQDWSVRPCVRPVSAVHMTAGHNALRGSGPDQQPRIRQCLGAAGLS